MTPQQLARKIPHEFREKILLEWLPNAQPAHLGNDAFRLLFEAFHIYVDPDAIPKPDCAICRANVYQVWTNMVPALIEAEKDHNALNDLL